MSDDNEERNEAFVVIAGVGGCAFGSWIDSFSAGVFMFVVIILIIALIMRMK